MYDILTYRTEKGNAPLEKYLRDVRKAYGESELAKIKAYIELLEKHGMRINDYRPKAIKQIDGDLWELRPDRNRVFFFYHNEDTFVLLHGFRKKQQQTPKHEIETAKERMKDYKRRYS